MHRVLVVFQSAALLVSATIGAGMFALPYVVARAGAMSVLVYAIVLAAIVFFIHREYARMLALEREHHHLTGFARKYLGQTAGACAAGFVIGGLLLALLAYLVLAGTFIEFLIPAASHNEFLVFWLLASLVLLLDLRYFVEIKAAGVVLTLGLVCIVFLGGVGSFTVPTATEGPSDIFFPFAPILFALAGWTALSPMGEFEKRTLRRDRPLALPLAFGTLAVVLVYAFFVVGIFGSTNEITPDTLSGLHTWPIWKRMLIGVLGLVALWNAYLAISREIKDSLIRDFRIPRPMAYVLTLTAPLLLLTLGLRDFFEIIGLAGGVFLAAQYIYIALVVRKAVPLTTLKRVLLDIVIGVFLVAAVYELSHFVIQ